MRTQSRLVLWLSCLLFMCAAQSCGQTDVKCDDRIVAYGAAPKEIAKKIEILDVSRPTPASTSGKRVTSPQGTAWFVESDPDYMSTKSPWTTVLHVGGLGHAEVFLQASFKDHGNTFSASWINEKLIFIQVWWGRIASSDMILDISSHKFIYNEFAHYGELIHPCH